MDQVRAFVDAVHLRLDVKFPQDDYFLNLLGTGRPSGRLPKRLEHLSGRRLVVLGSYKFRGPHDKAPAESATPSAGGGWAVPVERAGVEAALARHAPRVVVVS